jgi:predicted site-specific integrase-resolvase
MVLEKLKSNIEVRIVAEVIKLFSRKEAAEILKISLTTLTRYKKTKAITPKTIGGKDLYTLEEINRFIESR